MSTEDRIEANKRVVRRLYEYINENQADKFAAVVAPSYVDRSNNAQGPEGAAAAAANLHRAYDGLRFEIADLVGHGDLVAIRWVETGRHVGQYFTLKPTGQPFESRGLALYRVQDGEIVESWLGIDPGTVRAQQAAQQALEAGTR
jgi:predicted ester cyclase